MSEVASYKDDSITIEAVVDGETITETVRFKNGASIKEIANLHLAWAAGLKRGIEIGAARNTGTKPDA